MRMLTGKKQDSAAWWQRVKPQVRKMQGDEGVMIIDDSIEEKPYTDENEIVCWPTRRIGWSKGLISWRPNELRTL